LFAVKKQKKATFDDVIRRSMADVTPGKKGCFEEMFRLNATLRNRLALAPFFDMRYFQPV
jgi:hypothetical protein